MTMPNTPPFSDLDEAMDRLFDRELTRDEREALSAQLPSSPAALARFRETTDVLVALRDPIDTPDVSEAVLTRLRERPGFTTRRTRGLVTTGRLAAAAALLGAGAGVLVLSEYGPSENRHESLTSTQARAIDTVVSQLHDDDLAKAEIEALRTMPLDNGLRSAGLEEFMSPTFSSLPLRLETSLLGEDLVSMRGDRIEGMFGVVGSGLTWDPSSMGESAWQYPLRSPMLMLQLPTHDASSTSSALDPFGLIRLKPFPTLRTDVLDFAPDSLHYSPSADTRDNED